MELHISIRNLVEFVLRYGDIDNRKGAMHEDAMQEGARLHRMIQRRMGADYQAEVSLKHSMERTGYHILIEGRADGVIEKEELAIIDEIKCTYRDIFRMKEADPIHLAQAKCYAYIYAHENGKEQMQVQMTYCAMETEEIRYFHYDYTKAELAVWFEELLADYGRWADFEYEWKGKCKDSIKELTFPFPYRKGQKELATYVYQTIYHKKKLYLEAPTGVGKTISTVFPAVKAMGEGLAEKIFYFTAKTITRTVANDTFSLLRQQGLSFKTVVLTAKDKVCFQEETECNPVYCQYAKGHYDRVNNAIYSLLTNEDNFDRETIERYAAKYQVCPFELCLDMSLFADGVIGDYNYLFDPHVSLKRFFSPEIKRDFIFLIDEAHNLVERGRSMYSAEIRKEEFLSLKRIVKEHNTYLEKQLGQCNKELLRLKRECEDYQIEPDIDLLIKMLLRLLAAMDKHLEEQEESPVKKEVLELYFTVSHFLSIYEKLDEHYVTYSQLEADGSFLVKLFCVNPTVNLEECMRKGRSSILFSATFLPIQYYKKLLGAVEGDYEVYAQSVFDEKKKLLLVSRDVTSKYTRRTQSEYEKIAAYIKTVIDCRRGNYMVFFPSYSFLRQVADVFQTMYAGESISLLEQEEFMNEAQREVFLNSFMNQESDKRMETLVGLCVLGGVFSEGIDLKNDSLIGAVIVGTGLPMVCLEREILKQHFTGNGEDGFDYAYRFPGMNKVQQAAGRVIRTEEDRGVVVLLDERFLTSAYRNMFPKEWKEYIPVMLDQATGHLQQFWNDYE